MSSIKITTIGKGKFAYEDLLLAKHLREMQRFAFERDYPDPLKRNMEFLHKHLVNRDNIRQVYVHPMVKFVDHMFNGTISELAKHTSSKVW